MTLLSHASQPLDSTKLHNPWTESLIYCFKVMVFTWAAIGLFAIAGRNLLPHFFQVDGDSTSDLVMDDNL